MSERRCARCAMHSEFWSHRVDAAGSEHAHAFVPEERRKGERRFFHPQGRPRRQNERGNRDRSPDSIDRRGQAPSVEPTTGRDRSQGAPERETSSAGGDTLVGRLAARWAQRELRRVMVSTPSDDARFFLRAIADEIEEKPTRDSQRKMAQVSIAAFLRTEASR